MTQIQLYDTTLRDGAQRAGISFSVEDKVKIARKLDELGVHYIEGGWPGANPKDAQFFRRARSLRLATSVLTAFGSTRRAGGRAQDDPNLAALLSAETPVVTIVGKTWDLHVTEVLETAPEENLAMIADSVRFLKDAGRRVFFDAEHYFDGYRANPDYALACLRAAAGAGAEVLALCDTNGGALPSQVLAATRAAAEVGTPLGIHTHNDGELAVANTLSAVAGGALQVQGTINGYGERCGNANLCSLIPALQLKLGHACLPPERLALLAEVSHFVSEVANLAPDPHLPYVGASAFAHKGGLHVSAQMKDERSYQHIPPEVVGNRPRVLVSELSGRANIVHVARGLGLELDPDSPQTQAVLQHIKEQESRGFQYEGAEASFELLVRRAQPGYAPPFELVDFLVLVERRRRPSLSPEDGEVLSEATVKVKIGESVVHTAGVGNGPVNALDAALRKGLLQFYPALAAVRLTDYKVRILDETAGTEAQVRVLIESTDGTATWRTVGSSANIIEASWLALADALEFWLLRRRG
ncbi:MAG: citramalate synthase [Chloroflexi bacterium]|nr:citramalate synthase [Chloroflexota bacterium]